MAESTEPTPDFWTVLREQLEDHGIDLSRITCGPDECIDLSQIVREPGAGGPIKVVCVAGNIRDSVDALGESARDRVLMVRVDEHTITALDAWVETGAVKSRSEAAALFIREGLKVRARELGDLNEALEDVDQARHRLREKAREVLGSDSAGEA